MTIPMISKPMLAATAHAADLDNVNWPMLVSPKLDGIRMINHPVLGPVTRSFKPVPNKFIRNSLESILGGAPLDGELVGIKGGKVMDFNATQSAVMTRSGQPQYRYMVFDHFYNSTASFVTRLADAAAFVRFLNEPEYVEFVHHTLIKDKEDFITRAERYLDEGYEGAMLRDIDGPYKSGRSTLKQGWLLKYKEWADAEGTVVGFEERMHNANEDVRDNFDHAKRSSHKENMVPMGTLGSLVLDTEWGELRVGTGFDDSLRLEIWTRNVGPQWQPDSFTEPDRGRKVSFKYQAFGMQDKPRFPVFLHFREEE